MLYGIRYKIVDGSIYSRMSGISEEHFALNTRSPDFDYILINESYSGININLYRVDLESKDLVLKEAFPTLTWSNREPAVNQLVTITGLPSNTKVTWPDRVETIESSEISFEIDVPGAYAVVFENPLYLELVEYFNVIS